MGMGVWAGLRGGGGGFKDLKKRYVSTVEWFNEVRFSVKHRGSGTYTRFLRSFLINLLNLGLEMEG